MDWKLKPRVHSVATTIGISKRRGLGEICQLHCADLWAQEKVRSGGIELLKILGISKAADAFAKYLDHACKDERSAQ